MNRVNYSHGYKISAKLRLPEKQEIYEKDYYLFTVLEVSERGKKEEEVEEKSTLLFSNNFLKIGNGHNECIVNVFCD